MLASAQEVDSSSLLCHSTQQQNATQAGGVQDPPQSPNVAQADGGNQMLAGSTQVAQAAHAPAARRSAFFPPQQQVGAAGTTAQANKQSTVVLHGPTASVGSGRQLFHTADATQVAKQDKLCCKLPNTEQLMQQDLAVSSQEQQPQQQQADSGGTDWGIPAAVGVASSEPSVSCSTSPGSLQSSRRSDLLDSDDLAELAGLCDVLVAHRQQHQGTKHQHPDNASGADVAAIAHAQVAAGNINSPPPRASHSQQQLWRQQQWQEQCWHHFEPHTKAADATVAQPYTLQQPSKEETVKPKQQDQMQQLSDTPLMDFAVIAAQLQRLQHQITSAGHNPTQHHPPAGQAPTMSVSNRQPPAAHDGADDGISSGSADARSSTSEGTTNSSACMSGRSALHHDITGDAAAGTSRMVGLQQQLEQRMSEMKQRLSNICNGMLHEAVLASVTAASPTNDSCTQPHMQHTSPATAIRKWQVPAVEAATDAAAAVVSDPLQSRQQPHCRSPFRIVQAATADVDFSSSSSKTFKVNMKGKAIKVGQLSDEQPNLIAAVHFPAAAGGAAGVQGHVGRTVVHAKKQHETEAHVVQLTSGKPVAVEKASARCDDGDSSDSSWATVDIEGNEQAQQLQQLEGPAQHLGQAQPLHPLHNGLISPPDSIDSPQARLDMCTSAREQPMHTPGKEPRARGSSTGSSCSSDSRGSCGSPLFSCLRSAASPWLQTQHNTPALGSGSQSVVSGGQGRRAAEVAQTVSPLKQGQAACWDTDSTAQRATQRSQLPVTNYDALEGVHQLT
jgi:hypothetical protein